MILLYVILSVINFPNKVLIEFWLINFSVVFLSWITAWYIISYTLYNGILFLLLLLDGYVEVISIFWIIFNNCSIIDKYEFIFLW